MRHSNEGDAHATAAVEDTPPKTSLELDVPPDATPGSYPITVVAAGQTGTTQTAITSNIADQVDNAIGVTADFPSLSGGPDGDFTYSLTSTNNTPEQQTFTFQPTSPQGWTVTASPTAEARAATVTIDAGKTGQVQVKATPLSTAKEGSYDIQLYKDATGVLLNPSRRSAGILVLAPTDGALPSTLPLEQSLILAWWQLVALVAGTVVLFAGAYVSFMRQEVRA